MLHAMGKWINICRAIVFNTKRDNTKRMTKDGDIYHQGRGSLSFDGKSMEVMISVYPGREGMLDVSIEIPPPDEE